MTEPNPTPGDPAPNPTNPPDDPPAPPAPPTPDEPLREPGKKALEAERARVKALEQQIAELSPLKQIAELLGGKPTGDAKTDLQALTERLDGYEQRIVEEQAARWRAEVQADKGLTAAQAARLVGATKDELLADADALLALFPAAPAQPRNPAPDPSQGSRGTAPADLDTQIAEAEAKGDTRTAILLKTRKLAQLNQ